METIATTSPLAPQGTVPTTVPLGTSGASSLNITPTNMKRSTQMVMNGGIGFLYGNFPISVAHTKSTPVWQWETNYPMGSNANQYTSTLVGDVEIYNVPWDLLRAFFSKTLHLDYLVSVKSVKVADCRVSCDLFYSYDGFLTQNATTAKAYNRENEYKLIDETDDVWTFKPPIHKTTYAVFTDCHYDLSTTRMIQPVFIPRTYVNIAIRAKYNPNLMQPLTIDNIVVIFPEVSQISGFTAKSIVRAFDPILDYTPRPYFMVPK